MAASTRAWVFVCLSHLSVWVLGGCEPRIRGSRGIGWGGGVLDRSFCPVLFPHHLTGCPLQSGGNTVSWVLCAPLPRRLRMSSPEHASHLTLDSLQSTSPFVIADIIIPVYKHGVRSPVYKPWLPERTLLVSPLDLFNLNLEPLSHGQAAVNSTPVTGSLPPLSTLDQNLSQACGAWRKKGPGHNDPILGASVPLCTLRLY